MRRFAVLLAAALITGCAPEPRACGLVAAVPGVGLTIEAPLASRVTRASMEVCWDGACRSSPLVLTPVRPSGAAVCAGESCPAAMVAAQGFAGMPGLPKRPVRVRVTLAGAGDDELFDESLDVTPRGSFPNGPGCGESGPAARIAAGANGDLRTLD